MLFNKTNSTRIRQKTICINFFGFNLRLTRLLSNTVQCDSTLLANITTGRFLTGCNYFSQIKAVSVNQLMIDVLGRGDHRDNVTLTVTLSKFTGTRGGSSWSGPRYPWIVIQTCMCFLDVV